jgi:hypothetical protein
VSNLGVVKLREKLAAATATTPESCYRRLGRGGIHSNSDDTTAAEDSEEGGVSPAMGTSSANTNF